MSKDKGEKSNTSQEQLNLPLECKNEDHNWSGWLYQGLTGHEQTASRTCNICGERQLIVPKYKKPSPLPVRSKFSIFLADFKAKLNR